MKKCLFKVLCISILLSTTITQASPQTLPSRSQLINLLKNIDSGGLEIAGLNSHKYCDKVSVNSIKILKIGKASSNYYQESGNYIDSSFMVKLKVTGTCSFKEHYTFYAHANNDLDGDGRDDRIAGTLPIINEPLEVPISTDRYGDWVAGNLRYAGKNLESARIREHIKRIYLKAKASMGGRHSYVTIINSIKPGKGKGVYYGAFALSKTKFPSFYSNRATSVQRVFGSDYRPADWQDLIHYYENNGSVLTLFKHLGVSHQKGVFVTYQGESARRSRAYYAVHCSILKSKSRPYKRRFQREPLCLAFFDEKQGHILAVKISEYGKKPGLYPQKHVAVASSQPKYSNAPSITPFNHNKNPSQSRHSHAGRFHTHKLPRQGKAHRHGNGAIGK